MINICPSDSGSTFHVCCHFRGHQIATFEVDAEWAGENLMADPQLDPFEVLERLEEYYPRDDKERMYGLVLYVLGKYRNNREEVTRTYLEGELDRYLLKRARLEKRLEEVMDTEASLRSELQSLPAKKTTSAEAAL